MLVFPVPRTLEHELPGEGLACRQRASKTEMLLWSLTCTQLVPSVLIESFGGLPKAFYLVWPLLLGGPCSVCIIFLAWCCALGESVKNVTLGSFQHSPLYICSLVCMCLSEGQCLFLVATVFPVPIANLNTQCGLGSLPMTALSKVEEPALAF